MDTLPAIWAIAGIVLIGAEFLIPGFVSFFFGAGALLTALATALFPGVRGDWPLQALVWLGSSGLSLFALRRYLKPIFSGFNGRGDADAFSGKAAQVTEPLRPGHPGRVRFEGASWKAVTYTDALAVGDLVEVVRNDNLTLEVTKEYAEEAAELTAPTPEPDKEPP